MMADQEDLYAAYNRASSFYEAKNPIGPDADSVGIIPHQIGSLDEFYETFPTPYEIDEENPLIGDKDPSIADEHSIIELPPRADDGGEINKDIPKEEPIKIITFWDSFLAVFLKGPMNILILAVVPALTCYYTKSSPYLSFGFSVLALAPLAERLSYVTEQLCIHTNNTIAGLLNVTFGNATELIVGIIALYYRLNRLVQLSLLGSVLSNSLLVLGSAFLMSGVQYKSLNFNTKLLHLNCGLMFFSTAALVGPTLLYTYTEASFLQELGVSRSLAIVSILAYASFIYSQVRSIF
jgi:hypothetical protein